MLTWIEAFGLSIVAMSMAPWHSLLTMALKMWPHLKRQHKKLTEEEDELREMG